jgi:phospholipase/carboxylesterase
MSRADTANPHLTRAALQWGADPATARLAVLAVHGRGGDPEAMREVADRVDLPDVTYLAPAADGASWYPERFLQPVAQNEPELTWALEAVDTGLAQLADLGFAPARIVLLGFSQGACLLAEHLSRAAGPAVGGAALLTGGYVGPEGEPRTAAGDLAGIPVLLACAAEDAWVPLSRVHETARLLRGAGATVTVEVYEDLDHVVSDAAVAATRRLLRSVGPPTA